MNIFKKLTAVLMITALITASAPVGFAANIYDLTEETTIATGVTMKNIKRLTTNGWQNINIVEADLSDGRYGVKTLTNAEDISKLTNVKVLAETHDTLAAINGDFFSWKWDEKTKGSAVGGVVIDGVQHTSITSPWNFATVAQNAYGTFIFDYIDCAIAVAAPNGFITPIEHINKYDDLTKPIIYTKEWGPMSPGSAGTLSEIVIADDTVVSVNYDRGPVEFPENGYIIAFLRDVSPELLENFKVGDKVELGINYEPKFENIQFAVGAGTMLLKDGKKTEIINDIAGNHPRTAIGVNADSTKLYLVTVDGRQANAKGVTLSALADIMAEIGADDAANLDGGGSTTMVVKSPDTGAQEVANTPSDNYLRPVANGVGIVPIADADDKGFITIETDSDCVFKDTSIYLNVKVHDSLGNIIEADELEWEVTDGEMDGNYYTPESAGKQTVTVSYGGMTASKEFRVLENPVKIATGLKEYSINTDEGAYISLTAEDEKGYKSYVNLKDVDITLSSSDIMVAGNTLKSNKKGSYIATFNFGNVQTSALIRVGGDKTSLVTPSDISIEDNIKSPTSSDFTADISFAVFGNTVSKNTMTERLVMNKYKDLLNNSLYDLAIFVGDKVTTPDGLEIMNLKTTDYFVTEYQGNTFISLNSNDYSQWQKFFADAKNISSDNLFLILSQGINDDSAYMEEILIDCAEKQMSNTNVYVIHPGNGNIVNDTGIKHIGIPGIEAVKGAATATEDAQYHLFTVAGDNVSCESVKIYK